MAFVAVILLFCPNSTSILCMAPGGHIAIENINALCCASSDISTPNECQPDNELGSPVNGKNCTDLLMASDGRAVRIESYSNAAAGSLTEECLGNHLAVNTSLRLRRWSAAINSNASIPVSSAVPMRC
jgi:hypothetical protein